MAANASTNAVRALDILILLGEGGADGLALADLAEQVGEAKPAVHRSLVSLLQKGFAEPAGRHGYYRLGPTIPMLARRQTRIEPLILKYRPGMAEFSRKTGHAVYMMVQAGVDAVCAEMVTRSPSRQFSMGVGGRVPMGIAAGSVALMSMMSEAEYLQLLETNAPRYLNHPSVQYVDKAVVLGQILDAQRRGFAVNMGYYLPGEGGLGLPVRRSGNYGVDVAISFTAPLEMMTEDWLPKVMDDLRDCLGDAIR
ncbi:IclR family transcriptional regulator [Ciceribacter selenitireducens]